MVVKGQLINLSTNSTSILFSILSKKPPSQQIIFKHTVANNRIILIIMFGKILVNGIVTSLLPESCKN